MGSLCKIDGCEEDYYCKDFCRGHYARNLKYGNPLKGGPGRDFCKPYIDEILSSSQYNDECLIWPFGRNSKGYAEFKVKGERFSVHQYACEWVHGPRPDDKPVTRHLCGNGHLGCYNPNHLIWGTYSENWEDAQQVGKYKTGESSNFSVLTREKVVKIQEKLKEGMTQKQIAEQFGVHQTTISKIKNNKTWKRGD